LDRNLTILIAEDDDDYQVILERALRDVGVSNPVQMVCDGQEVIEYLTGSGKYQGRPANAFPSVMFLDLKMPRRNGLDILCWMREHRECAVIPTMVMSSSNLENDIGLAYQLGANGFFVKPLKLDDLKTMLRVAYDFWKWSIKPPFPAGCAT
jgi:CheY-like chemotaxis protein